MYGLGQRFAVAEQIEKEMPGVKVRHACGKPFHIHTEINGKRGKEEMAPGYYNTAGACCLAPMASKKCCQPAIDSTVKCAKEIEAGAPVSTEMER